MVFRIIIGCLAVIIHIFSNSSAAAVDILSEHYKLAVGQGECSTTVSTLTQKDMEAGHRQVNLKMLKNDAKSRNHFQ